MATHSMGRKREEEATPIFDIPRLDNISIDGKADDWGDRGFRVELLGNANGRVKPAFDFDALFRLGWDERGLLLLVKASAAAYDEAKQGNELWEKDSVEIFYSPQRGSPDVVQLVVSPGVDPQCPKLRSILQDGRKSEALKKTKVTATALRTKTANGYTLEVLLPWGNFGIKPETGRELAFQIYINDTGGAERFQALWYPIPNAHESINMHRVRLSGKPSPPVKAVVFAEYDRFRRVRVDVAGTMELLGKTITLKGDGRELGSARTTPENGRAGAKFVLPMPPQDKAYGPLDLFLEGQLLKTISLPDLQQARAKAFMEQRLDFNPSVFPGPGFPKCDFEQPSYVEDLIGPYTLTTTFYDADYNPVATAEKPGRYGAVVEIKTGDGKTFRRLRTLFRTREKLDGGARENITGPMQFPKETGIHPTVVREQKFSVNSYLKSLLDGSMSPCMATPALMAALYETKPGAKNAGVSGDFLARDRQWWVGLKRKLAGADKLYRKPFVCPEIVKGKPATMLHKGTLKAAGMKPDATKKIDALLRQWSADTEEPFAVCVARHGVIVLHKAYGRRNGKAMTVDTKSWMASITKAMSGTVMMMLVDQGLANLDDPVSKYLPSFRDDKVATPLTIRHLYTHTTGLQRDCGDDPSDFDDVIAGYYPYMPVGKRQEYNNAGAPIGSKIVEIITGEALPQFYKRHLLEPLGCANTDVTNSSGSYWGGARSVPMDIAKFGQMLLNRGSYGNKRFMSAETFQQMLPVRLTRILGPDTSVEWGIGLIWFEGEGLGKGSFGHGAASSATLRIDPEHDLVIVMCRNGPGRNFAKYHSQFLGTIVENMAG
ncbi:MAG: serine hydrolase [Methylacidiphilales bacterium]|nr:serine hydrolase [Candidatus Methylacidiphilales bacterium]